MRLKIGKIKSVAFTEKQMNFIKDLQDVNETKFQVELRAILDDYMEFFDCANFEKCSDCRWDKRHRGVLQT